MATSPVTSAADRAAQTGRSQDAANVKNAGSAKINAHNEVKAQLNAQIVQSSLNVSLKSRDQSLSLVYKSVINSIGETMEAELGKNPLPGKADNSAEATAQRILDFATGFFDTYAKQNPGKDPDKLAKDFVELVRGGFEKGFNEARDILDGMGVLGGSDVEKDIMKTYDLVSKGFDDFLASKLKPQEGGEKGVAEQQG